MRAKGLKLWIDEYKIPGGSNWSAELVRAIKACCTVLIVVSRDSLSSTDVEREISFAGQQDKPIVALQLEPNLTIPDKFAYWLSLSQAVFARGEPDSWIGDLLAALERSGMGCGQAGAASDASPASESGSQVTTSLMPFLADRDQQERLIYEQLGAHLATMPNRPIAFFLHGDRSQCIDGFLDRLGRHTLPRHLKRLGLADQIEWKHVPWPQNSPAGPTPVNERVKAYRLDVTDALDLPASANSEQLASRIGTYRKSVVFSSQPDCAAWNADEFETIGQILRFWSSLPNGLPSQLLIILIGFSFEPQSPTLLSRFVGMSLGRQGAPKAFARPEMTKLQTLIPKFSSAMTAVLLPELADVSQQDVKDWIRRYVRPSDTESAMQKLEQIYKANHMRAELPVPMDRLLPLLKELLPPAVTLRGL